MTNSDAHNDPTADGLSQELLNLAWDLSEGLITETDQARLNELLLQSATNRAAYAEFMQLIAYMERGYDQSTQGDIDDARWIFDPSVAKERQRYRANAVVPPVRVPSTTARTTPVAVACAALCMLLATFSIACFIPHPGQTVARTVEETNIAKTDRQHQLPQRNVNELSPENDPVFQKQLEELVQMSSGGP